MSTKFRLIAISSLTAAVAVAFVVRLGLSRDIINPHAVKECRVRLPADSGLTLEIIIDKPSDVKRLITDPINDGERFAFRDSAALAGSLTIAFADGKQEEFLMESPLGVVVSSRRGPQKCDFKELLAEVSHLLADARTRLTTQK